jgi:hypothetical protein
MIPHYREACFTFRFADRIIPRFYLEGVDSGRRVSIIKIDPATGERQDYWRRQRYVMAAGLIFLSSITQIFGFAFTTFVPVPVRHYLF